MRSSRIGAFGSHIVSPVVASLRPAAATISPATALSSRSRLFAWTRNRRATFSFLFVRTLSISWPGSSVPLKMRMNTTLRPSSIAILNASAANGSLFFGARTSFSARCSRGSTPVTGGTSAGDGR